MRGAEEDIMSDDKIDVIIVGGGIAGLTAGYLLAKKGQSVLLIERGNYCGSKNVTGGRIYTYSLEKIMPGFTKEAPLERKIMREKVCLMTNDSNVSLDFYSDKLGNVGSESYSVLRASFDQWLQEKAEDAGVQIVSGVRIDDLIVRDGHVCGVVAGEDKIEADVTILADGVNSLLAEKIGLSKGLDPRQVSVGAKEIIGLSEDVINDRFQCRTGEGAAWLFAGFPSGGRIGGGFLYTNRSSISLGVVCNVEDVSMGVRSVPELVEDLKAHPAIAPLIKGGKSLEYSAHLVPEGGLPMMPEIVGDGVLVIGDAAGFCLNLGYAVRGMDLAVISAECAAEAIERAKESKDYSKVSLSNYQQLLDDSILMKDMKLYRKVPHFMEKTRRMYAEYPNLAVDVLKDMFVVDGTPAKKMRQMVVPHLKKIGFGNLLKDMVEGGRSL